MPSAFSAGLLQRLVGAPRKVVVLRASRIGDFICATPALGALREALPGAEISLLGLPVVRDLAERQPWLDRFIPFPGFPGIAEQFFDAGRTARFLARMHDERFDLAIQMHGSGVYSNPFTLLLGARVTAGMVRPGEGARRLDAAFPFPEGGHEVDRLLAYVSFLGARPRARRPQLSVAPRDRSDADARLAGSATPLLGIHPGAREATKRWPAARFAAAADRLWRERGGTVVIVGGPDEAQAACDIERQLAGHCLNLAGRTSLPVMSGVIARLSVLVTNDSAPAHMAYAHGTPTVTLFGGTDPARWGPREGGRQVVLLHPVACRPCQGDRCPHAFACLEAIGPEQVVAAVRQVA